MSDDQLNNILLRLQSLEDRLQHGELTEKGLQEGNKELETALKDLKSIVSNLDTRFSVYEEKYTHLSYQISKLEKAIQDLEDVNDKNTDHKRDVVENIFMIVLGAVVTYLFSMFQG
ncbi:MAG: hypothetical protein L0I93_05455 [Atopostipes suicloacalis]|nr:hypothetical protein [Atopostipes suicloacalis]